MKFGKLIILCLTLCLASGFYFLVITDTYFVYRDGGELSTRELQKMVQALPQYSEQIEKLSLHVDVSVTYLIVMLQFYLYFWVLENSICHFCTQDNL